MMELSQTQTIQRKQASSIVSSNTAQRKPAADAKMWAEQLRLVAEDRCRVAYAKVFAYFAPRLKSFGYKLLGSEALSMEMVQDTMLNVWMKSHLFNPEKGSASTWIFTIARNVRYDMLRKISNQREDIISDDLWPVIVEAEPEEHTPYTELENLLLQGQLENFFPQLPEKQMQVIQMVYLEEKSQQQAADELNVPLGTIKSRIRLAIKRLHQCIEVDNQPNQTEEQPK